MTHICVSKLTIIGSDNGLSPGRRQAIIWTNAGILLIWTLRANFSEILSEIHAFSFKKMHVKMSSAKWRPSCPGLNVLSSGVSHTGERVPAAVLTPILIWFIVIMHKAVALTAKNNLIYVFAENYLKVRPIYFPAYGKIYEYISWYIQMLSTCGDAIYVTLRKINIRHV